MQRVLTLHTTRRIALFILCLVGFAINGHAQERKRDAATLFPIRQDGKWGYIDRNGGLTIRPQFDNAHNFNGGLARVWRAGKQGYIDKTGNFVWKPTK